MATSRYLFVEFCCLCVDECRANNRFWRVFFVNFLSLIETADIIVAHCQWITAAHLHRDVLAASTTVRWPMATVHGD